MLFYKNSHYINNYTSRYLIYKTTIAKTNNLPKISLLTIKVYYNPYRYEYPFTYINDFIFVWYKYTQQCFTKINNFFNFKKEIFLLKHNLIKTKSLNQQYYYFDKCLELIKTIHTLGKQNIIKNSLFSTPNFFLINKKNHYITYNLVNKNTFFITINKINFEQLTKGYNFILNPIDFYTDFKFNIMIKMKNIYPYHTAWLLNFLNFNYFFTAEHYKYKKFNR